MPRPVSFRLTNEDMLLMRAIGERRHALARKRGYRPVHGAIANDDPGAAEIHVVGSAAEYATSQVLNLSWRPIWDPGEEGMHGGDVGGLVEVRGRRIPGTGKDLVLRPSDALRKPYVLVHVTLPVCTLVGWIYGGEGRAHPKTKHSGERDIYFVHGDALRDVEELKQHLRGGTIWQKSA